MFFKVSREAGGKLTNGADLHVAVPNFGRFRLNLDLSSSQGLGCFILPDSRVLQVHNRMPVDGKNRSVANCVNFDLVPVSSDLMVAEPLDAPFSGTRSNRAPVSVWRVMRGRITFGFGRHSYLARRSPKSDKITDVVLLDLALKAAHPDIPERTLFASAMEQNPAVAFHFLARMPSFFSPFELS